MPGANLIVELCVAASALCPSGPEAQALPIPPDYVFVIDGDLAPRTWDRLRDLGYRGRQGDGADALYVDRRAIYAVADEQQDADFVATYLSFEGTRCTIEHKADPDFRPELVCSDES